MQIGPYTVEAFVDGLFALDGGAVYGVVPKPVWERVHAADERNRVDMAARCLFIETDERRILVETGLGSKFDKKRADIFKVRRSNDGLVGFLEHRGFDPADITDVILTHLHFDHCGGTTRRQDERLVLTFPNAVHHVQRRHWDWAHRPTERDAGSFRAEDFSVLDGSRQLNLIDGDAELFPGLHLQVVDGHTPGAQLVRVEGLEATLLLAADLVGNRAHLRWAWVMSYDNQPLVTLAEKRQILSRAAAEGWIVVFGHDPECTAATLREEVDGVVVDAEVQL